VCEGVELSPRSVEALVGKKVYRQVMITNIYRSL